MSNDKEIVALRALWAYDPETGVITSRRTGRQLGSFNDRGYVIVHGRGRAYKAHRVAFALMLGRWPTDQVDHVNMRKGDNRWVNLREADNSRNNINRCLQRNNTSGYRGVTWNKGRWRARLKINGVVRSLGRFRTPTEAAVVQREAAFMLFGDWLPHSST